MLGADVSALVRNEQRWQWAVWRAYSWWWPDVFLFVSLKQLKRLLLPALCFALCWTLLQQRSKTDRLSTAYLLQCKTMAYICLICHEALRLPAAHCMSCTAFLFCFKLYFFTLQILFSLSCLQTPEKAWLLTSSSTLKFSPSSFWLILFWIHFSGFSQQGWAATDFQPTKYFSM